MAQKPEDGSRRENEKMSFMKEARFSGRTESLRVFCDAMDRMLDEVERFIVHLEEVAAEFPVDGVGEEQRARALEPTFIAIDGFTPIIDDMVRLAREPLREVHVTNGLTSAQSELRNALAERFEALLKRKTTLKERVEEAKKELRGEEYD